MIRQKDGRITEIRAETDDGGDAVITYREDNGNYDVEVTYRPGTANDLGRGLTLGKAIDRLGPKAAAKVRKNIEIVRNV